MLVGVAAGGPVAAVIYFAREVLALRKVQMENEKLRRELDQFAMARRKLELEIRRLEKEIENATADEERAAAHAALTQARARSPAAIELPSIDEIARYGVHLDRERYLRTLPGTLDAATRQAAWYEVVQATAREGIGRRMRILAALLALSAASLIGLAALLAQSP
ncbi:MAG: hypothetical protein AB7Q97_26220 [Gammaproteobacteria bacterium]